MKFSLPAFALGRPVTVLMLSLTMVGLGVIAWFQIPLEFMPSIENPFIGCQIVYPGATPEQVEQQLAIPAEGEFRTIPGLRTIETRSSSNGLFVGLVFEEETDMARATADVRDRMERLKLVLPQEVDRMMVQRFQLDSLPVMFMGLFTEHDLRAFSHTVEQVLEPALRRVDGVANVEIHSMMPQEEVVVEFDQNVLRARDLGLAQLVAALRQSSLELTVGQLNDGHRKSLVRVKGDYRRLEELKALVVGPNALRLSDVAEVRYAVRDDPGEMALDGRRGVVVAITKESEANTVSTCRALREAIDETLASPEFEGTRRVIFLDQSEIILDALDNLKQEGLYGAAMALVVLFVFLHRLRPTIIVALTIPSSLMVSLVFLFLSGMTLNLVTMVSMIISVGMLVDNAIVVVENIIRYHRMGYDIRESAKRGASEVGLAIFAATSTTWVVFVPMYYMGAGNMAVLMKQLGLPLIVALGGSLVIALTVVPLAMSHMRPSKGWLSKLAGRGAVGRGVGALGRVHLIQRIINGYAALLGLMLRHRLPAMLVLLGLVALTIYVPFFSENRVGMRQEPKMDQRHILVRVQLDQTYDKHMVKAVFDQINGYINSWREELGIHRVFKRHGSNGGRFELFLYTEEDGPEWETPPFDTQQVATVLRERLPRRIPGGEIFVDQSGQTETEGQNTMMVKMRGDDRKTLLQYARRFAEILSAQPMIAEAEADEEQRQRELQLSIDQELAEKEGISALAIAQTVDIALRGATLPYMKQEGREVPVWAQFREQDRRSRDNLDNVTITGASGELVPLVHLVDYSTAPAPWSIHRVDGKNVVYVKVKTATQNMSQVGMAIQRAAASFELPAGYSVDLGQDIQDLRETLTNFIITLAMATVLIYLVMAALFESYLLPLSILSSVPLALGGGVWMLYFSESMFDPVTLIGCVLMTGLIVNNGIVIVDHINQLRQNTGDVNKAIVEGGRDRFRPVFMTAITTILGVVPLAMAKTGGAATFAGLGQALIGGLTAGTLLTLLVVPLFYSLIDGFQQWCVNFFGAFGKLGKRVRGMP